VVLCLLNAYHNLIIYSVILSEVTVGQGRGGWDGVHERVLEAKNNHLFIY
jgi:hypothetical protein